MCGKNHNLKSSCDILFWTVEDTQASSTFFLGKIISTVNFDICALQLSERRRGLYSECTAVVFCHRPSWRHSFCQLSIISVFLKVPLSSFQLIDDHISFMRKVYQLYDKGCRVRRFNKSLFITELSV